MGQAIAAAAEKSGASIVAGLDVGDDISSQIDNCDVVIDFSHSNGTSELCRACAKAKKPTVTGTTAHSNKELGSIHDPARTVPVVLSPTLSVAVKALLCLTR